MKVLYWHKKCAELLKSGGHFDPNIESLVRTIRLLKKYFDEQKLQNVQVDIEAGTCFIAVFYSGSDGSIFVAPDEIGDFQVMQTS